MHQPTIEKLQALRLGAMADALTAQLQQPEIDAMPFAERLALLVDIQHSAMLTAALAQRLTRAGMRQRSPTDASPTPSRVPTHGSGPMRIASPSPWWTFTSYSLPVLIGAPKFKNFASRRRAM